MHFNIKLKSNYNITFLSYHDEIRFSRSIKHVQVSNHSHKGLQPAVYPPVINKLKCNRMKYNDKIHNHLSQTETFRQVIKHCQLIKYRALLLIYSINKE